ncbi:MAG: cobalamin biosynthesis protein [Alphaproteobacteria bacterium]|nr:cobalamin biosynthesis protein [Alphaproteobacteria bacterium]
MKNALPALTAQQPSAHARRMPLPFPGGSPDSLFFLLIALVVNALLGGVSLSFLKPFHPEALLGQGADWFDRRLNREKRSERNRIIRGALVTLLLVGFAFALGVFVLNKAATAPFGRYLEILLLAVLIPVRQVFDEARLLGVALKGERFDPSRVPFLAEGNFDSAKMDSYALARLAIERLAEGFGKDVVAPVFWFALLGLPGVFLSRAGRVLAVRIGSTDAAHRAFGFASRRLDAALGFLPVRLAGLVLVVAALFTPTAAPAKSARALVPEGGKHPDMNAGWPVAATAGALDLALLGPRQEAAEKEAMPWIGSGRARATHQDIRRALYLFFAGGIFTFGLVAALAYHA